MRHFISFFFVFLMLSNLLSAQQYDVVIVGGGISGLAAAEQLKDYKVLILEKEDKLGGRIQTKKFEDITYELGAFVSYPPNMVEFDYEPSTLIPGTDSIGMLLNGKIEMCTAPLECMYKAGFTLEEIEVLKEYDQVNGMDLSKYPEWKVKILNSFFNIVQSGDIRQYNPKRQLDALKVWTTDHYENGNSELVYELRSRFTGKVELNALVKEVKQENGFALTTYEENGKVKTVKSKTVLVTPPAPISKYLVKNLPEQVNKALNDIDFNQHSVTVLITKNDQVKPFRYITTPELYSSTVIQAKTQFPEYKVYYIHYSHKKSELIKGWKKEKVEKKGVEILTQMFGDDISEEMIVNKDHATWNHAASIVTTDYYSNWNKKIFHPLPSIYFAGDWLDPYGFPLGIYAAYKSGVRASKLIDQKLKSE